MSTQEILVEEIKKQPEPVLREVLHYLKFLARQREEETWTDVLPTREVEQEVLLEIYPEARITEFNRNNEQALANYPLKKKQ
ncbi:MAG: hypothetical protein ABI042_14555 [Verrucomicrobiota bacterium]